MEPLTIQQQVFNNLKNALPPHLSLVDELSGLLGISPDSVYRRLRGEKPLTLQELKIICEKYNISLDQMLQLKSDAVVFQAPKLSGSHFSVDEYFSSFIGNLKHFNSFGQKQILYSCKDLPPWYFYYYPEIAAFKTFVWLKTLMNHPDYLYKKFSLKEYPFTDCFQLGQQTNKMYNLIPSSELWSSEVITASALQLSYYRDAGLFADIRDLHLVIDSFLLCLDHIQQQAEKGYKFMPGENHSQNVVPFKLFINEILLGGNEVLVELNGTRISFIPFNFLNTMHTTDTRFTEISYGFYHTLMSRSTLISEAGEKERNRFFSRLTEKINAIRK
jgi:BetR domain